MHKQKMTAPVAAVMAVVLAVVRVLVVPKMQNVITGRFELNVWVIGLIVFGLAILTVLGYGKWPLTATKHLDGKGTTVAVVTGGVFGAVLLVTMVMDLIRWRLYGITPAPNATQMNTLDGVTLFGTILFGVLGGIFLLWVMLSPSVSRGEMLRQHPLWVITPALWQCMRLARYELSYASAMDVARVSYDFIMMIASLLFLFALARYISGVGKPSKLLVMYAGATAMLCLSGAAARAVYYLAGDAWSFDSSRLVGPVDAALGLFALAVTVALTFADRTPVAEPSEAMILPEDDVSPEQTATEEPPAEEPVPEASQVDTLIEEIIAEKAAQDEM